MQPPLSTADPPRRFADVSSITSSEPNDRTAKQSDTGSDTSEHSMLLTTAPNAPWLLHRHRYLEECSRLTSRLALFVLLAALVLFSVGLVNVTEAPRCVDTTDGPQPCRTSEVRVPASFASYVGAGQLALGLEALYVRTPCAYQPQACTIPRTVAPTGTSARRPTYTPTYPPTYPPTHPPHPHLSTHLPTCLPTHPPLTTTLLLLGTSARRPCPQWQATHETLVLPRALDAQQQRRAAGGGESRAGPHPTNAVTASGRRGDVGGDHHYPGRTAAAAAAVPALATAAIAADAHGRLRVRAHAAAAGDGTRTTLPWAEALAHGQSAALATMSSAPAAMPPQGAPGGSGRLEVPRARHPARDTQDERPGHWVHRYLPMSPCLPTCP